MVEFNEAKRFFSFLLFFCGSCLEHLTWSVHYNAPQRGPSCTAFPSYLTTDCIFFFLVIVSLLITAGAEFQQLQCRNTESLCQML